MAIVDTYRDWYKERSDEHLAVARLLTFVGGMALVDTLWSANEGRTVQAIAAGVVTIVAGGVGWQQSSQAVATAEEAGYASAQKEISRQQG